MVLRSSARQGSAHPKVGAAAGYGDRDTEPNDLPMAISGLVLTAVGGVVAGVGGYLVSTSRMDDPNWGTGLLLFPVGGLAVLVGIPLAVAGFWPVPVDSERPPPVAIQPYIGPAGVGVTGRF
jgi:hypothetical protein